MGKVVYSTDGTEKQILEESISYLKFGDHATMLPEKITHRYAGQMGLRHTQSRRYAYDAMGNITHIYEDGNLIARYTYDTLNRLVREDSLGFGTRLYTYDACGNIVSRRRMGFTLEDTEKLSSFIGTTAWYEYDGDRMVSYNGEPCSYDAIGNPSTYRGKTAQWIDGRRLASYDGCSFTYDGMGRRMTKGNINYTYDFDGRLLRQSDGVRTLTFLYDHTGLAAVDYVNTQNPHFGGLYTYVKDIQGNVISLIDKDGNPMVKYTYDAWGNHTMVSNSFEEITDTDQIAHVNPYRYRGYYFDTETGLYYLKTRYYDPEVGRFINADSVTYLNPDAVNGLNLFAYCDNNPIIKRDEEGTLAGVIAPIVGFGLGVAVVNDIYQLYKIETEEKVTVNENGVVSIEDSHKVFLPLSIWVYSFYLNHINPETKDVLQGTTWGVANEWMAHTYGYYGFLAAAKASRIIKKPSWEEWMLSYSRKAQQVDLQSTIFDNSEGTIRNFMVAYHMVTAPISCLIDFYVYRRKMEEDQ